jgi:hypothetical protein
MTPDTLLDRALRALREQTVDPAHPVLARATEARIGASLHHQRSRASRRTVALGVLGLVAVGSTGWATATGRLPPVARAIERGWTRLGAALGRPTARPSRPHLVTPATAVSPAMDRGASAQAVAASTAPAAPRFGLAVPTRPAAPETARPLRTSPDRRLAPGTAGPSRRHLAPAAARPSGAADASPPNFGGPSLPSPAGPAARGEPPPPDRGLSARAGSDDADEALYRAAHEAHFGARAPAAAVRAWERYLRAQPHGRFRPEAEYNRALCLIRLGRDEDARAALAPFISSGRDGYRSREARALLEALSRDRLPAR